MLEERVLRNIMKETWRHCARFSKVTAIGFLENKISLLRIITEAR